MSLTDVSCHRTSHLMWALLFIQKNGNSCKTILALMDKFRAKIKIGIPFLWIHQLQVIESCTWTRCCLILSPINQTQYFLLPRVSKTCVPRLSSQEHFSSLPGTGQAKHHWATTLPDLKHLGKMECWNNMPHKHIIANSGLYINVQLFANAARLQIKWNAL